MASTTRAMPAACALAASVVLGGCFSTGPGPLLITPENADYPFKKITVKGRFESGDKETELSIVRDGDAYVLADGDGRGGATWMVKAAGEDTFVVQQKMPKPFTNMFVMAIVKRRGDELDRLYCGSYSIEQLAKYNVKVIEGDEASTMIGGKICRFTKLEQLVALAAEGPAGPEAGRPLTIVSLEK